MIVEDYSTIITMKTEQEIREMLANLEKCFNDRKFHQGISHSQITMLRWVLQDNPEQDNFYAAFPDLIEKYLVAKSRKNKNKK
jgi:hypothetical protein